MTYIIDFKQKHNYKVMFNLPVGKVVKINKQPEDNFDIEIHSGHGIAYLQQQGKTRAAERVQRVFPTAEIIETTVV